MSARLQALGVRFFGSSDPNVVAASAHRFPVFRAEPTAAKSYYLGMRGLDGDTVYRAVSTLLAVVALVVVVSLLLWGLTPS